ncbi:MAG: PP2C family serine/threonine-protein phosphatase [Actinomycetota bacterium]
MAELRWGAGTHPGRVRTGNEDNLFVGDGLFVVADGMGGHEAGEVASRIAVDRIRTALSDDTSDLAVADANATPGASGPDEPVTSRAAIDVVDAVRNANGDIFRAAIANPTQAGMGTTITAIAVIEDPLAGRGEPNIDDNDPFERDPHDNLRVTPVTPRQHPEALVLANVGDSRTYLFRHGRLRRVTVDHNYVSELVANGHITDDEARFHPRRNIITRALGIEPDVTVDWWTLPIVRGDRFLLCSDGLVDEVTDAEITAALEANADPQQAVEVLIEQANQAGGRDNITIVVVDVLDGDDPPEPTQELDIVPSWADDDTEPVPRDLLGGVEGYVAPDDGELAVVPVASLSRKQRRAARRRAAASPEGSDPGGETERASPEGSDPGGEGAGDDRRRRTRRRRRWAIVAATLVVLLVAGGVAGGAWARRGFYVDFDRSGDDGEVTVFQGRRGGVLWIEPTLAAGGGISRGELDADGVAAVTDHRRFDSLDDAVAFVRSIAPSADDPSADDPPDDSPADDPPAGDATDE